MISSPQIYAQEQSYPQGVQIKVVELTGDITDPSSITSIKEYFLGGQHEKFQPSQEYFATENPQSSQDQTFIPLQQQQQSQNVDYLNHQRTNEHVDYSEQAFIPQEQQQQLQVISNNPVDYFEHQQIPNEQHTDYPDQAFIPQQQPNDYFEQQSSEHFSHQEQVIRSNTMEHFEQQNTEHVDYSNEASHQQQQQHQEQFIPNNSIDNFEQQSTNAEHVDSDKSQHFEPSEIPKQENISIDMPTIADETKEHNNGENPQEINQPPASQQVILTHEDTSSSNNEESMINYAPVPTQDLGDEEEQQGTKESFDQSENPVDMLRGNEPILQLRRSAFVEQPHFAYSYQNLNLNPYGKS